MVAADRARRPGRGGEARARVDDSLFAQQLVPQKPSGKAKFLGLDCGMKKHGFEA